MKIFEIAENDAGQRLDKFLRKLLPQATRALLYKINRTWKVKISSDGVNFKKQDNEYKLVEWEKVKIFLSENDFAELSKTKTENQNISPSEKFHRDDIVYEDNHLLIVNKSAWVTVHPWDHKTDQVSLIEQVQDYLAGKLDSLTFKPSLVHRIDRDTSGIVMIAKKKDILTKLVLDLKEHSKIKKTYYVIVEWLFEEKEGTIDAKIERIEDAKNQNKVRVSQNGQKAISHYKVIDKVIVDIDGKRQGISFLEVQIETGRMHQIRVHMAHIWHRILGDNTYGDKGFNYILSKKFGLARQMLHAWKIEFFHYWLGRIIKLESRFKKDMADFMRNIGKPVWESKISIPKSHEEAPEKIDRKERENQKRQEREIRKSVPKKWNRFEKEWFQKNKKQAQKKIDFSKGDDEVIFSKKKKFPRGEDKFEKKSSLPQGEKFGEKRWFKKSDSKLKGSFSSQWRWVSKRSFSKK